MDKAYQERYFISSFPIKKKKKKGVFCQARLNSQMQISLMIIYSSVPQKLIILIFDFSKIILMYFQNKRNNQLPTNKKNWQNVRWINPKEPKWLNIIYFVS